MNVTSEVMAGVSRHFNSISDVILHLKYKARAGTVVRSVGGVQRATARVIGDPPAKLRTQLPRQARYVVRDTR